MKLKLGWMFSISIIIGICAFILLGANPFINTKPLFDHGEVSSLSGENNALVINVISDVHHLAPKLRGDNEAFHTFMDASDGKLLEYSTEILSAFASGLEADVLIVSGDLTTNGEKDTHLWLASYFEKLEHMGTEVFVIPGNHDIDNPYATGFNSGGQRRVNTVTAKSFAKIYEDFGYDQAYSRDPASLSYVVRLTEDTFLLMLDTNKYEDNQALGYPQMSGDVREETLSWLSDVNEDIHAQVEHPKIISVSHHNLLSHSPVHDEGFVVDHPDGILKMVNEMGITLNFSGHIHIQDIEKDSNRRLTEIVTSSLIQFPQNYGVLSLDEDGYDYHTEWVDVENYAQVMGLKDAFLLNFRENATAHFKEQSMKLLSGRLSSAEYSAVDIAAMTEVFAELNSRYFEGIDSVDQEDILNSKGYQLWVDSNEPMLSNYVKSMLLDESEDNQFREGFE